MNKKYLLSLLICCFLSLFSLCGFSQAGHDVYLNTIKQELKKTWPNNRMINLVFHGHSVPTGYFRTPEIRTLESYPFLSLKAIKSIYPNAAINVIRTSIGGENSEQGEKRFVKEVLIHQPDVLFIDYALNDRSIGVKRSRKAMEKMIKKALKKDIKVILLTPSPDLRVDFTEPGNELEPFTNYLIELAKAYEIGLVDSYRLFQELAARGEDLRPYMAQSNHPNKKGHQVIADEIVKYFE